MANIYKEYKFTSLQKLIMNKPNVLSNELDQISKTGEWYKKELNNLRLHEEILDAFFYFSPDRETFREFFWDQTFFMRKGEKQITERFRENKHKLPISQMLEELKK